MIRTFFVSTLILAFAEFAIGQGCPTLELEAGDVAAGQEAIVTMVVKGGPPKAFYTYNWSVSAGSITSGQGKPLIYVGTNGLDGQNVTVNVEVGGLPPGCIGSKFVSFTVKGGVEAQKLDEYGNINRGEEKARLDNFAISLRNGPDTNAVIIAYGGRKSRLNEAKIAMNWAKGYLTLTRKFPAPRVTVIDGGYREDAGRELWIVPNGAAAPDPTPTVPKEEVTFPKKKAPAKRKPKK